MTYIFLQEGYDPKPDANSLCTKAVINELEKDNEVYVVCDGVKEYEQQFSSSSNIIHVLMDKSKGFGSAKSFAKVSVGIKRVLSLPRWPIRFSDKVNLYVKAVEELLLKIDNDVVLISVYRPAEMVEVGFQIKKKYPTIKWVVYNLDGIDTNVELKHREWFENKERTWQRSRYSVADRIIQMETHKTLYQSVFSEFVNKTTFSDYPLIVKPKYTLAKIARNNTTRALYSGIFYKDLREPFKMMEWFENCFGSTDAVLSIYTRGEFVQAIIDEEARSKGKIKRFDFVSQEEIEAIMQQSDLLVCVGNYDSPMVPSKVFVYISSGKPIVHFAAGRDDSCLPYLKKYDHALIIYPESSMEDNCRDTKKFIENCKSSGEVSFERTRDLFVYNTPEYTANILRSI